MPTAGGFSSAAFGRRSLCHGQAALLKQLRQRTSPGGETPRAVVPHAREPLKIWRPNQPRQRANATSRSWEVHYGRESIWTATLAPMRRRTAVGPYTASLGPRVRELRKELGWTLEDLGFHAGFHPTYVSDLERGRVAPSFETVARVARAMGTTVAELYPDRLFHSAASVDGLHRRPTGVRGHAKHGKGKT